jgi:hypothetical protein
MHRVYFVKPALLGAREFATPGIIPYDAVSLLWERNLMVPVHLNAVQIIDRVTGSMPDPFNMEKIRAEQQSKEKKKAEREEVVWKPSIVTVSRPIVRNH